MTSVTDEVNEGPIENKLSLPSVLGGWPTGVPRCLLVVGGQQWGQGALLKLMGLRVGALRAA